MKTEECSNHVPFTETEETIIARVEVSLAAGLTVQRLSLETGIDAVDINKILKRVSLDDHWKGERGNNAAAISAFTEWLSSETAATQTQSEFAITPTLQNMQSLFAFAHKNRRLLAITGSCGIGKSQAAEAYAKSYPRGYRRPGAVRIEFGKSDGKPAAALAKILGALRGEVGHAYRNGNLHDAIGAALNPGDLLIFDECNYLDEAMDIVRSIYDDFGVAIVMIGNPKFKETVWGKRSPYSALASRTDRFEFHASQAEDIEVFLDWKGVLVGMKPAARKKLIERAVCVGIRPDGGLRAIANGLDLCAGIYRGAALDGELLEQVINQTSGAVA